MDMITWLRQQIEGDKAHAEKDLRVAQRATPGKWRALYGVNLPYSKIEIEANGAEIATFTADRHEADVLLVARMKPPTVIRRAQDRIADCDAKLEIIDEHQPEDGCCRTCTIEDREVDWDGETETVHWVHRPVAWPCRTVLLIVRGYRHRDGHNDQWIETQPH
jgi:hypothetical protein